MINLIDKQRSILDEIPELKMDKRCTFIGALEAVLNYLGENTDYVELMGMSGAAFRIQFNVDEWSASSIDMFSRNESASFLGYYLEKYRILNKDGSISTPKHEFFQIIKDEIDSGRPVIGLNLLEGNDWGVITGYDGDDLLVRDYNEKESLEKKYRYPVAKRFPNIIFTLRKNEFETEIVDSVWRSLSFSLKKFRLRRLFDEYANGFSAYNAWLKGISDEDVFSNMDKETYRDYGMINGLMYSNLHDARKSAFLFLKRISDKVVDKDLEEAAEFYGDLEKIIWDHRKYFPLPFDNNGDKNRSITDGKFNRRKGWTPEMRKKGYKSLRLIKKMEYRAFKSLERAVDKWEDSDEKFMNIKSSRIKKGIV